MKNTIAKTFNRISAPAIALALALLPQVAHAQVCLDTTIQIPNVEVLPLVTTGSGDTEMKGHNPAIVIDARIRRQEDNVLVTGSVTMTEDRADWTTFHGGFSRQIFIGNLESPECQITGVDFATGALSANGGNNNHRWTRYSGSGIINSASCLSDTRGDDAGKLGCRIEFGVATVRLSIRTTPSTCGPVTISIPNINALNLPHTGRGDTEMKGHNPSIAIDAQVRRQQQTAVVSGTVTMTEDRADWTTFRNTFSRGIFIGNLESPECAVVGVRFARGSVRANGGNDNHRWTRYSGNGIINSARCLSDTRGDDAGKLGCTIEFGSATVLRANRPTPLPTICAATTISIPNINVLNLPHTGRGDTEIKGHNPSITIDAQVRRQQQTAVVTGTVTMREDRSDWTTFRNTFARSIFIGNLETPECAIQDVQFARGRVRANGGNDNHRWTRYSGSGIIDVATCLSDTRGDDAGKLGCRIELGTATVVLTPRN